MGNKARILPFDVKSVSKKTSPGTRILRTSYGGDVVVFENPNSPSLYYRVKKPDGSGWKPRSAHTQDPNEALTKGEEEYGEMRLRQKVGLSSDPTAFCVVAEAHTKRLRDEAATVPDDEKASRVRAIYDYVPVVERYFIPFFGDKPVEAISAKDMDDYKVWRKSYWTTGPGSEDPFIEYERKGKKIKRPMKPHVPSKSKLDKEDVCLRQLFATGVAQGLIREFQIPKVKSERISRRKKHKREMKPAFSPGEFKSLMGFMDGWVKEGTNSDKRVLLRDVIAFLCDSGVRPGTESDSLKWKNVAPRETPSGKAMLYEITVTGKTGEGPAAVGIEGGIALARILSRRLSYLKREGAKIPANKVSIVRDEFVIGLPDGTPIRNAYLSTLFDKCLEAAGMRYNSQGKKRSIYCTRHTFARNQLNANCNIYWLSRQMRTSVQMLERYYGDTEAFRGSDQMVSLKDL
jgi:hypothetical protein